MRLRYVWTIGLALLTSAAPAADFLFEGSIGYASWNGWERMGFGLSAGPTWYWGQLGFGLAGFCSPVAVHRGNQTMSFVMPGGLAKARFSVVEAGFGYGYVPSVQGDTVTNSLLALIGLTYPIRLSDRVSVTLGAENVFAIGLASFYNPSAQFGLAYRFTRPKAVKRSVPPDSTSTGGVNGPVAGPALAPDTKPEPITEELSTGLPPFLEATRTSFADREADGVLDAMETGEITLAVKNRGKGDAQDLTVYVAPMENYADLKCQAETKVPTVKKGDSVTVRIPVSAGEQVETQTVKLRIDVKEPYFGADADAKVLSFSTRRLSPPDLVVAQTGVDDDEEGQSMGNSNGTIEPGETFELAAIVQNKGTGNADDVRVTFREPSDKNVMLVGTSDTAVGSIAAGDWKKVVVPVYVNKRIEKQSFDLPVAITERRPRFSRTDTISLSLNKQMKRPDEISVAMPATEQKSEAQPLPELTADVDVAVPFGAAVNANAVAVIVAGYEYDKVPRVDYAARDAAVLRQYLLKTLGFKEENFISLRNPSKADFERVFGIKGNAQGQLYNYVRKGESDVFVYYTGHGAPDLKTREAFLVPADADPSYINLQGYPLSTFFENLAQIPAKSVTVVLDACFSGAYDQGLIVQQASPLVPKVADEKGKLPDGVIMASASGDQVSSWYADKKHSLFTYWFLKGLQGAADKNGDKTITMGEMKLYLSENVSYWAQRLHNRIQTPTFSGDENRALARLK